MLGRDSAATCSKEKRQSHVSAFVARSSSFVSLFTSWWTFRVASTFGYCEQHCCSEHLIRVIVWPFGFISLEPTPRGRIAGTCGASYIGPWRNLVFWRGGCAVLHPPCWAVQSTHGMLLHFQSSSNSLSNFVISSVQAGNNSSFSWIFCLSILLFLMQSWKEFSLFFMGSRQVYRSNWFSILS